MNRLFILCICIVLIGHAIAVAEQEGPSGIEGLRCDSCGMECSSVCGSRAFRTCCFNYIKKRSDPSLSHNADGTGASKSAKLSASRNLRRSASWTPSELSYALEQIQDDRRWYPYYLSDDSRFA